MLKTEAQYKQLISKVSNMKNPTARILVNEVPIAVRYDFLSINILMSMNLDRTRRTFPINMLETMAPHELNLKQKLNRKARFVFP